MKALVLGASGATGKLVVMELAMRQVSIRIVVRESAILPEQFLDNPSIEIERGNITEFSDSKLGSLLQGCDAVVSCLGHNITMKGMFGQPRNLVSDTIKRISVIAKEKTDGKVKLILMSTTAYTNSLAGEKNGTGERIILAVLKLLLPPHRDNMLAADCLQELAGNGEGKIEWVAVRPDTLVEGADDAAYELHEAPVLSPIFNAGKTSRANVSRFIADLLTSESAWKEWRFKMPVIYNVP